MPLLWQPIGKAPQICLSPIRALPEAALNFTSTTIRGILLCSKTDENECEKKRKLLPDRSQDSFEYYALNT